MPTLSTDPLADIARLFQARCGMDVSRYKPRCLMRRLGVRMRAVGAADLAAYASYLESRPEELDMLFEALAINFSSFNRDPAFFRLLGERVLPDLARRIPAGPLRLWSAGCSAGEELYSLGILADQVLPPPERRRVLLLGTDIDERALAEARAATYPRSRLALLDKSLIGQYFDPVVAGGDTHRVIESVRRRAEFRRADLIGPSPFRQVSLICCRNVLIYLEPRHQETVLDELAAALVPGGILALGRVERLAGERRPWFETVDTAERVYRRRAAGGAEAP